MDPALSSKNGFLLVPANFLMRSTSPFLACKLQMRGALAARRKIKAVAAGAFSRVRHFEVFNPRPASIAPCAENPPARQKNPILTRQSRRGEGLPPQASMLRPSLQKSELPSSRRRANPSLSSAGHPGTHGLRPSVSSCRLQHRLGGIFEVRRPFTTAFARRLRIAGLNI